MTKRESNKPDPLKDPRGFLRQVFDHRIDDESDVLGSIYKRLDLISAEFQSHRGSINDRFKRLDEMMIRREEAFDVMQAYLKITGAIHADSEVCQSKGG